MPVKLTFRDRLTIEVALRSYIDDRYAQSARAVEAGDPEACPFFDRHAELAERVMEKIINGQALKPAMLSTEEELGLRARA